jgi:hypothetical protein
LRCWISALPIHGLQAGQSASIQGDLGHYNSWVYQRDIHGYL